MEAVTNEHNKTSMIAQERAEQLEKCRSELTNSRKAFSRADRERIQLQSALQALSDELAGVIAVDDEPSVIPISRHPAYITFRSVQCRAQHANEKIAALKHVISDHQTDNAHLTVQIQQLREELAGAQKRIQEELSQSITLAETLSRSLSTKDVA